MSIRLRSVIRIVRRRYLSIIYWIVRALAIMMIPFGLGVSLVYAQNTEPPDQAPITTAPDGVNQDNAETTMQEQNIPNLAIGVSNTASDLPTGFALGLGGASTATLLALAGSTNTRGGQNTTSNPAPTTTQSHINQTSASREQTNPPLVAQVTSVSSLEENENEEAEEEGGFRWPEWARAVVGPVVGFVTSQSQSFWQTLVRTGQTVSIPNLPGFKLVVENGKVFLKWVVGGAIIAKTAIATVLASGIVMLFATPVADGEIPEQERERLERERLERERQQQIPQETPPTPAPQLPAEYPQWQQDAYQFVQNVINGAYSNSSEDHQAAVTYLQSLQTLNQELIGAGLPPVTTQEFINQVRARLDAGRYISQISYYLSQAEAGESVDLEMFRQLTNNALYLSNQMEARQPGSGFYPEDIRNIQLDWMRDIQQQRQYVAEINDYIARAEAGETVDYETFRQVTNHALHLSNQMEARWPGTGFYSEEARQNHLQWLSNIQNDDRTQEEETFIVGPDGTVYGPDDPVPDTDDNNNNNGGNNNGGNNNGGNNNGGNNNGGNDQPPPRPPRDLIDWISAVVPAILGVGGLAGSVALVFSYRQGRFNRRHNTALSNYQTKLNQRLSEINDGAELVRELYNRPNAQSTGFRQEVDRLRAEFAGKVVEEEPFAFEGEPAVRFFRPASDYDVGRYIWQNNPELWQAVMGDPSYRPPPIFSASYYNNQGPITPNQANQSVQEQTPQLEQRVTLPIGTTAPIQETTVSTQTEGQLVTLSVDVGDTVQAGQVIGQVDTAILDARLREEQNKLRELQAALQQAQSQTAEAEAEVTAAEAKLQQAQTEADRYRELFEQGVVSRQDYEQRQTAANVAEAEVNAVRQQVSNLQQAEQAAQADISAQQAVVDRTTEELSRANIVAPTSGVIVSRSVEEGDTLQTGTEVVRIGDLSQVKVVAQIPPSAQENLQEGQQVQVQVGGQTYEGTVARISPQADPNTGLIPVEVIIPDANNAISSGVPAQILLYQSPPQNSQPQSYQSPPTPTTPIASGPQTITYTVQPGDTLETIAQRFYGSENTVVPDIAQLNALEDSEILQTGQEVQVPVYN